MRRKRRRRKPWFARLFGPGGILRGGFSARPKVSSTIPASSAVTKTDPGPTGTAKLAGSTSSRKPAAETKASTSVGSPLRSNGPRPRPKLLVASATLEPGETPLDAPLTGKTWFSRYWRRVGGGSLLLSLCIHLVLLGAASLIVTSVVRDRGVNFLPGGG